MKIIEIKEEDYDFVCRLLIGLGIMFNKPKEEIK